MMLFEPNALTSVRSSGRNQAVHFVAPKNHRFLFLDALRGIAAIFVVFFHVPAEIIRSFHGNSQLAVDFFFCLSGFVIAFSYEKRLKDRLSFLDFSIARWIRLYPLYVLGSLIGIVFVILIQKFVFHNVQTRINFTLFFLAAFLWPTRLSPLANNENFPLNTPAWSLFYEIVANLAYAVLVKLRADGNAILLSIVAVSWILLVKNELHGGTLDVGARQVEFGMGFARAAYSFFAGVLICRLYRSRDHTGLKHRNLKLLTGIVTLSLVAILFSPWQWMCTEVFRFATITLCFPVLVYGGAIAQLPRQLVGVSTALGELSYPLYMLHVSFVGLLDAKHFLKFANSQHTFACGITLCLIALCAYASWWIGEHVDVPLRRILTNRYNIYRLSKITPTQSSDV